MGKFTTAYKEELRMPARQWLTITFGLTVATVLAIGSMILWQPGFFSAPLLFWPTVALIPLVAATMLFYPIMKWEQRGSDIERDMHLFITRMGVLSASESARKEMFDILARMREYRSLAVEINKIFTLVDKWNVSLEKACRFVAQMTPSEFLADFLNRLAHGVEGGEPAEVFFQTEQQVVMNQYALRYQAAMTMVEWMKEIFVSIVVAVLFVLVFATLAPFISRGEDPNAWLGGAIGVFLTVEIMFLAVLTVVVPGEDIWHNMAIQTPTHVMVNRGIWAAALLSIGFFLIALFIPPDLPGGLVLVLGWALSVIILVASVLVYPNISSSILEGLIMAFILVSIFFCAIQVLVGMEQDTVGPGKVFTDYMNASVYVPLAFAYIISPWIVVGHFINKEEDKIKRRDENFAAFLRSLGAAVSATSKDITVPLSKLRRHDFGPLSKNVDDLYKRLSLRILRPKAWEYFSAETLSELISKFSEMYVEGIKAGGSAKKVSHIISDNFLKIVGLRKMKYVSASSLSGILYGLCFAISFVLNLTLVVLRRFDELARELNTTFQGAGGGLVQVQSLNILNAGAFDFNILGYAIISLIVAHAFISAVMTRIISGGHKAGAFWHFVLLVWTGSSIAVVILSLGGTLMP